MMAASCVKFQTMVVGLLHIHSRPAVGDAVGAVLGPVGGAGSGECSISTNTVKPAGGTVRSTDVCSVAGNAR